MTIGIGEGVSIGLGFLAIVAPDFWPKMPKGLSYALAAVGLAWLTYSAILGIEDYSAMKLTYGPLAIIIAGAMLLAGGVFWHISRIQVRKTSAETPPQNNTLAVHPATAIYADCGIAVAPKIPSTGKNYFISIQNYTAEQGGGGLGYFFGPPGSVAGFQNDWGYECRLTNEGTVPVFNMELVLALTFTEAISQPNTPGSMQSGAIFGVRTWTAALPRIDPGRENAFVIYLNNMSKYFVDVSLPEEANLQIGLDPARQTVRIIKPITLHMVLTPHIDAR